MKAFSLIFFSFVAYANTPMPQHKRNIFNIEQGINFKCEGMLSNSFNRFNVVTKYILPAIEDVKFLQINFDSECNHFKVNLDRIRYLYNILLILEISL